MGNSSSIRGNLSPKTTAKLYQTFELAKNTDLGLIVSFE